MIITRRVEFDAGHRVPSHRGKCRYPHGHRYRMEVSVEGMVQGIRGESDDGMVMDFGCVKDVITKEVVEWWDHRFLVYRGDGLAKALIEEVGHEAVVMVPCIPTAEGLAHLAAERIQEALRVYNIALVRVRLYETPNSWADWVAHDIYQQGRNV